MMEKPLGTDLRIIDMELGSDLSLGPSGDVQTITEEFNLGQAIVMRLRTRRGELADLGHSRYGSRLYELIGEPNTDRTRELARQYSRECILQDPRVREIVSIQVEPSRDDINRININASVMPIGKSTILNIVFPFYLEVA